VASTAVVVTFIVAEVSAAVIEAWIRLWRAWFGIRSRDRLWCLLRISRLLRQQMFMVRPRLNAVWLAVQSLSDLRLTLFRASDDERNRPVSRPAFFCADRSLCRNILTEPRLSESNGCRSGNYHARISQEAFSSKHDVRGSRPSLYPAIRPL
jgi:hypothetical protein